MNRTFTTTMLALATAWLGWQSPLPAAQRLEPIQREAVAESPQWVGTSGRYALVMASDHARVEPLADVASSLGIAAPRSAIITQLPGVLGTSVRLVTRRGMHDHLGHVQAVIGGLDHGEDPPLQTSYVDALGLHHTITTSRERRKESVDDLVKRHQEAVQKFISVFPPAKPAQPPATGASGPGGPMVTPKDRP
ncbi:MAG: hypothetical protein AAF628_32170 [Planctomycetota bacterium]